MKNRRVPEVDVSSPYEKRSHGTKQDQVAQEEAYNFTLLSEHLQTLDFGYGDFPTYDGLWEMADAPKTTSWPV